MKQSVSNAFSESKVKKVGRSKLQNEINEISFRYLNEYCIKQEIISQAIYLKKPRRESRNDLLSPDAQLGLLDASQNASIHPYLSDLSVFCFHHIMTDSYLRKRLPANRQEKKIQRYLQRFVFSVRKQAGMNLEAGRKSIYKTRCSPSDFLQIWKGSDSNGYHP